MHPCNHYQGWFRRHVTIGQTTLALLIALIAVISPVILPLRELVVTPDSNLRFMGVVGAPGANRLVATNSGERAGVVSTVLFRFRFEDRVWNLEFAQPDDAIVPAGELVQFSLKPGPSGGRNAAGAHCAMLSYSLLRL